MAAVGRAGLNSGLLDCRVLDLDRLVLGLAGYLDCLDRLGAGCVARSLRSLVGLPGSGRPLASLLLQSYSLLNLAVLAWLVDLDGPGNFLASCFCVYWLGC